MRRNGQRLVAMVVAAVGVVAACSPAGRGTADRPVVLTTFTVLADIAANVAGEHLTVESITKPGSPPMIFIVVKFDVARRHREDWISITREFTAATRAEPGNLWFEWSRSVDNPAEYVLVGAFRDQQAGVAHMQSQHFRAGPEAMRPALTRTPRIIHTEIDADGWSAMGELQIDAA